MSFLNSAFIPKSFIFCGFWGQFSGGGDFNNCDIVLKDSKRGGQIWLDFTPRMCIDYYRKCAQTPCRDGQGGMQG